MNHRGRIPRRSPRWGLRGYGGEGRFELQRERGERGG